MLASLMKQLLRSFLSYKVLFFSNKNEPLFFNIRIRVHHFSLSPYLVCLFVVVFFWHFSVFTTNSLSRFTVPYIFSFRGNPKKTLSLLSKAADSICDGDLVEKLIRQGGNWSMLPMQVCVGTGLQR